MLVPGHRDTVSEVAMRIAVGWKGMRGDGVLRGKCCKEGGEKVGRRGWRCSAKVLRGDANSRVCDWLSFRYMLSGKREVSYHLATRI
jgi:hypothetical protein